MNNGRGHELKGWMARVARDQIAALCDPSPSASSRTHAA
jgi:hypothetical protein